MSNADDNFNQYVRAEIEKLRDATSDDLHFLRDRLCAKRLEWYHRNKDRLSKENGDLLMRGYKLLLEKMEIKPEEAPIVLKTEHKIVFHSQNFCPTLEACIILGLDTRFICRELNEQPTDVLVKQISPRLRFSRNYAKLRPHCDYCEEMIEIMDRK